MNRWVRAALEIGLLLVIYAAGYLVVRETRLAETLLASGGGSVSLVVVAFVFVVLRLFVVLFFPGWLAAVLFVRVAAPALWPEEKETESSGGSGSRTLSGRT